MVVSRIGGLRTLVREGETGLFFDPYATDAIGQLADKLKLLAAQPLLGRQFAEAGWREVHEHYTWSAVNQELETIYAAAERHVKDKR